MKTRTGFVSNSSTTSFVIIGFLLDTKQHPLEALMDKLYPGADKGKYPEDWAYDQAHKRDARVMEASGDNSLPKGKTLVGVTIASFASDDCGGERSVSDFPAVEAKVQALRDKLGLTPEDAPTKIVTGSYAS